MSAAEWEGKPWLLLAGAGWACALVCGAGLLLRSVLRWLLLPVPVQADVRETMRSVEELLQARAAGRGDAAGVAVRDVVQLLHADGGLLGAA